MISKIYAKFKEYIKNNKYSLLFLLFFACLCFYKLPYVVYAPGGAIDLEDRVIVDDGYDYDGKLQMAYVSMIKCNIPIYLLSQIIPSWDLMEMNEVTYEDTSIDETIKINQYFLEDSKYNAIKSVFDILDKEVVITNYQLNVVGLADNIDTSLKLFDVILAINGNEVKSTKEVQDLLDGLKVGDIVSLRIIRDNKYNTIETKLVDIDGHPRLGVIIKPTFDYQTTPEVKIISTDQESGSSGGLMTALSLYNKLTPNDITSNKNIIGTGTINEDGTIGEIGGIKYKLTGAINNDADVFICPIANYDEAIEIKEKEKSNITIIAKSTLSEVIDALKEL